MEVNHSRPNWLELKKVGARTIVFGDVHGCLAELDRLLEQINYQPESDTLLFTGDLVSKGPDSIGVIRRVRALGGSSAKGNHDARWIAWRKAQAEGTEPPHLSQAHQEHAKSIAEVDWAWFVDQPDGIVVPDLRVAVVHGGLVPNVPFEKQQVEHLHTMRNILEDGTPTKSGDVGEPWGKVWAGPWHVYYGHDAKRGIQEYPYATGLDSGCVYGGALSACILPERKIVSVPAARRYSPVE